MMTKLKVVPVVSSVGPSIDGSCDVRILLQHRLAARRDRARRIGAYSCDLGQHHPELVEIFFCLDILCRCLGDGLQFFLLHNLPILTRIRDQ